VEHFLRPSILMIFIYNDRSGYVCANLIKLLLLYIVNNYHAHIAIMKKEEIIGEEPK